MQNKNKTKKFNNKHYDETWYNKKVRFPVYESGVLHNVLIIMGNSLSLNALSVSMMRWSYYSHAGWSEHIHDSKQIVPRFHWAQNQKQTRPSAFNQDNQ